MSKKKKTKSRAVASKRAGKESSTAVRIDKDVAQWFHRHVKASGEGDYQDAINEALRGFIDSQEKALERALRKIVREELRRARR